MATVWLSASGTNTDDGSTYALAKKTLNGASGAISVANDGDTVNVVNDGTHSMTGVTTAINFVGTNYTDDVGLTIRGVTENLTPVMATVAATAGAREWARVWDPSNYITIQGINFDYTALAEVSEGTMRAVLFDGQMQNVRVLDCECRLTSTVGSGAPVTNTAIPQLVAHTGASASHGAGDVVEVANCVHVNALVVASAFVDTALNFHNNVFIYDADSLGVGNPMQLLSASSAARRFYHNTIVVRKYDGDPVDPPIVSNADDTAVLAVHSNLLYVECATTASPGLLNTGLMEGVVSAAQVESVTTGYDLIALGPVLTTFLSTWTTQSRGLTTFQYNDAYRAGGTGSGTDVPANTELLTGQTLAEVFNTTTGGYTWTPDTYSHDLPYDLRLVEGVGVGGAFDGGVPGALDVIAPVDPDVGGGIEYPEFVDSLPFFRPVFHADVSTTVRVSKNNIWGHIDERTYLRDKQHDESIHRRFEVEGSARVPVTLGGVNEAVSLMIETDQTLNVTLTYDNGTTDVECAVTVSDVMVIEGAALKSFSVNNTSSSTATVYIAAFQ